MTARELTCSEHADRMAQWLGVHPYPPRQRWILTGLPPALVDRLDVEVSLDYVDDAAWAAPRVRSPQTGSTLRELLQRWASQHLCEPVALDVGKQELTLRCEGTHGPQWRDPGWRPVVEGA